MVILVPAPPPTGGAAHGRFHAWTSPRS